MATKPRQENPYERLRNRLRTWAGEVTNPRTRIVTRFNRADCERGTGFNLSAIVQQVRTAELCEYAVELRLTQDNLEVWLVAKRPTSLPDELY